MTKMKLWRGLTATMGILFSLALFLTALCFEWGGQVNAFLGIKAPTLDAAGDTMYYDVGYKKTAEDLAKYVAEAEKHASAAMSEGAVLLKNTDAALPLSGGERRVTLFGRAVADPVYRGNSGGAGADPKYTVSLYDALADAGFAINDTLFDAYAKSPTVRVKSTMNAGGLEKNDIGEETKTFYTTDLQKSWADDFSDAAIVLLSRTGGEGGDLAKRDKDGVSQLALHPQEADLLEMICQSGKFAKTIVLLNSAYPMEVGFLDDAAYGVDACLWISGPGTYGFRGVADMLVGKTDPSGHLVDTYVANSLSAPATQNSNDYSFNDNISYVVYAEGIYHGYKYYETRYQDCVLGVNNAKSQSGAFASNGEWNYAEEVTHTFGYGRSYASFTQTLESLNWDRDAHTVTAKVKVRNNGAPEGSEYKGKSKDVVQLYVQLPYAPGNAQKSAIQLAGFAKTKPLATDEEDTLEITADDYLFATYDSAAVNGADASVKGCYVFDAGDYFFAIGDDSHDALNNVLSKRGVSGLYDADGVPVSGNPDNVRSVTLAEQDNKTYAKSRETGAVVGNLFDYADINYYYDNDPVTYLDRDDWTTFPREYDSLAATEEMLARHADKSFVTPSDAKKFGDITMGANVTLELIDMKDVPFTGKYTDARGEERDADAMWEKFLDQLTVKQMCSIIGESFGQPVIKSIKKPGNTNYDGPSGPQGAYGFGDKRSAVCQVDEVLTASTWNRDLLAERGKLIAIDAYLVGVQQLWSPGANMHRTPFSGRNFEYYSEDGTMSYLCGRYQTDAMQKYGICASIKHFCGNDMETNRTNICNFMQEQTWRQYCLKGFEGAFTGSALGSMMSFTALGMNNEFYSDTATLTGVVRKEWGWKGVNITDNLAANASNTGNSRVDAVECLVAGTDTFNAWPGAGDKVGEYVEKNKNGNGGYVLQCLREANKRFYYAMLRTTMMNGVKSGMIIEDFIPWWQPTLIAVDVTLGVVAIAALAVFVYIAYFRKKKASGEKI